MLSSQYADKKISFGTKSAVLILDNWKLIEGEALGGAWTGPTFPNASGYPAPLPVRCGTFEVAKGKNGCLFDVVQDPSEYQDLAAQNPQQLAKMHALLEQEAQTVFNPNRGCNNNECAEAACAAAVAAGGYWAPYLP